MAAPSFSVIGAGNMGTGIVRRLTAAGHRVMVTDHDPAKAAKAASEGGASQPGQARAASEQEAVGADIVVLALWYPGTVEFAKLHSAALGSKIVIDIANPFDETFTGLTLPPTTSAAEELAKVIPDSFVVKAFNTIPATTLLPADVDGQSLDILVASDHAAAKATVLEALQSSGLRAMDAGVLANSRLLERLIAFGIELGQRYGIGFEFGFKYLPTRPLTIGT